MLKIKQKYKIIIILFALSGIYASAQVQDTKDPNEIHLYLGAGFSAIHHQHAKRNGLFNGSALDFGIGYLHYFHKNWGIYLGMGAGTYNTNKTVDVDVFTPNLIDQNDYAFDLYSDVGYNEIFQTQFLSIPLMLHFQTKKKSHAWRLIHRPFKGFYLMGGLKANIPFKDRYEAKVLTVSNAAYYPEMDNWAATQLFAGLGKFNDGSEYEGNLEFEMPLLSLAFETGLKWRLNRTLLYTGIFCDIGVHNSVKNVRTPINNNIAVAHLTDFPLITYAEKLNMVNLGIILRIAFFKDPHRAYCPY